MTELRTFQPGRLVRSDVGYELPEKPILQFGNWQQEAAYLKIPSNPEEYINERDLVLVLAYCEKAKALELVEEDIVFAITILCLGNWIERHVVDGTLSRTQHDRSIVLNWT